MPELPEVETTVRGLASVLDGQRLDEVNPRRADLRRIIPTDLRQRLTGATVTGLSRRAKYGLIDTDRGDTLIFHLGMSGRWRVDPEGIGPHDHLILRTGEGRSLALHDPRRFGSLDLVETAALPTFGPFLALGPEPLGPDFNVAYLARALKGRVAPIKAMLLDQRIVAGLGNIYVCEALHRSRISPFKPAGRIAAARLEPLAQAVREVLTEAIAAGGATLRDYAQADGALGYFQHRFRVYDREGRPCQNAGCAGVIARKVQAGRSTFYCPVCQK